MSMDDRNDAYSTRDSLAEIHRRSTEDKMQERKEKNIRRRLAARSYHLPGYSWCKDWVQYMMNNHPLLGICCHHKLHPLGLGQRLICLIGSIAFGLAATNFVFLYYSLNEEADMNKTLFKVELMSNTTDSSPRLKSFEVTEHMFALWTFGGVVHSAFDLTIWYFSACSCCLPGGILATFGCGCCRKLGNYVVVGVVMVTVAIATFVVVWRAARMEYLRDMEEMGINDDQRMIYYSKWKELDSMDNYSFLYGYVGELAMALFVFYPVLGTILFSGILGCGRLPLLGGRPREVWKERAEQRRRRKKGSGTIGTSTTNSNSTMGTETIGELDWDNEDMYGP
uniref:Uncharacterized protein n=1 Tax=Odontella aurita TaxID=265563 RepID=A0A7S4NAV5_9STRA|mmetsp:Transcript_56265/g.168473  ORF Transcript_56265/g.168473 Transcript_56265/m.168473 type:complete len:338 (+) Transcript_56265:513-1526(+)